MEDAAAVQLGQKLKHPRIEFEDINSSGCIVVILQRQISIWGVMHGPLEAS